MSESDRRLVRSTRARCPPQIACSIEGQDPLGVDPEALIAAMQVFVDHHWRRCGHPGQLVKPRWFLKGGLGGMVFRRRRTPRDCGFAYPISRRTGWRKVHGLREDDARPNHDLVSVSASHERVEMLVDPAIN